MLAFEAVGESADAAPLGVEREARERTFVGAADSPEDGRISLLELAARLDPDCDAVAECVEDGNTRPAPSPTLRDRMTLSPSGDSSQSAPDCAEIAAIPMSTTASMTCAGVIACASPPAKACKRSRRCEARAASRRGACSSSRRLTRSSWFAHWTAKATR